MVIFEYVRSGSRESKVKKNKPSQSNLIVIQLKVIWVVF